jgi:putative transposase
MKKYGRLREIVTDGLRAYSATMREVGNGDRQEVARAVNNRAENSHRPFRRREGVMQRFRRMKTLQNSAQFTPMSTSISVTNVT